MEDELWAAYLEHVAQQEKAARRRSTCARSSRGGGQDAAGLIVRVRRAADRMTDPTSLALARARDLLRQKKLSAVELADAHIAAIERARALNAFVVETPEQARAMARNADAAIARREGGPLAGIPLGVKD